MKKFNDNILPAYYMFRSMRMENNLFYVSMYLFSSIAQFGPDLEIHVGYSDKEPVIDILKER